MAYVCVYERLNGDSEHRTGSICREPPGLVGKFTEKSLLYHDY
jgi:hypothetical protein